MITIPYYKDWTGLEIWRSTVEDPESTPVAVLLLKDGKVVGKDEDSERFIQKNNPAYSPQTKADYTPEEGVEYLRALAVYLSTSSVYNTQPIAPGWEPYT
jgi:hypothetical protein